MEVKISPGRLNQFKEAFLPGLSLDAIVNQLILSPGSPDEFRVMAMDMLLRPNPLKGSERKIILGSRALLDGPAIKHAMEWIPLVFSGSQDTFSGQRTYIVEKIPEYIEEAKSILYVKDSFGDKNDLKKTAFQALDAYHDIMLFLFNKLPQTQAEKLFESFDVLHLGYDSALVHNDNPLTKILLHQDIHESWKEKTLDKAYALIRQGADKNLSDMARHRLETAAKKSMYWVVTKDSSPMSGELFERLISYWTEIQVEKDSNRQFVFSDVLPSLIEKVLPKLPSVKGQETFLRGVFVYRRVNAITDDVTAQEVERIERNTDYSPELRGRLKKALKKYDNYRDTRQRVQRRP